jgi:hypothetical protein
MQMPDTLLHDVDENWKAFWFNHGVVVKNLRELSAALDDMNAEEFAYHVNAEKNDVAEWVEHVVGDTTLATKLRLLSTIEAARRMVARRVDELAAPLPAETAAVAAPAAAAESSAVEKKSAIRAAKKPAKKSAAKKPGAKAAATKKSDAPVAKKSSLLGRFLNR